MKHVKQQPTDFIQIASNSEPIHLTPIVIISLNTFTFVPYIVP